LAIRRVVGYGKLIFMPKSPSAAALAKSHLPMPLVFPIRHTSTPAHASAREKLLHHHMFSATAIPPDS